ncbi:MAG: type II secretion system protein [Sumerlaeia bacterium]
MNKTNFPKTVYAKQNCAFGFTLIELIIVVAIIAILAAIAVPNFLEAQTRAKVVRVKSDFRVLALALEEYHVDQNRYPAVNNGFSELAERLRPLSTPISYLTNIPEDSFVRRQGNFIGINSIQDPSGKQFLYNTSNITVAAGNPNAQNQGRASWSLTSGGPDLEVSFPYYAFSQTFIINNTYINQIYDPTNGTISSGDLFRRGGAKTPSIPQID